MADAQNAKGAFIFGAFPGILKPTNMHIAFADDLRVRVVAEVGEEAITDLLANSKSKPACLIYLPTAASILLNSTPVLTRLNISNFLAFAGVE